MKRQMSSVFALLLVNMLISCANPTTYTASPEPHSSIRPGGTLGEMVLEIAKDETGEPDVYNYCSPIITDSDPRVLVRTCQVPQLPYLFIGYAELANTQDELESLWAAETWQLYFDENAVDLEAFGFFDNDWEGYRMRRWKIAVENLSLGAHTLRYVISRVDNSQEPLDVTWAFTVGDPVSQVTSSPTSESIIYPTLSSIVVAGQHPYTSEKSKLNFLLYLPANYEMDTQQKWPLILFLHGSGERGNNLDFLIMGGLPKKLQAETDFPFLVISPQGNGEYEFWSKEEMVNSLFVLLDEVQAKYSVDSNRIYLTGASAGGEGTWNIGLRYPNRFAALVPVMGYYGYPFNVPANICDLKDVPIWAFHGAKDETIPLDAEEGLVNALKACGGNAQITIFPNAGHDIANEAYANSDLYTWMLSQTLK